MNNSFKSAFNHGYRNFSSFNKSFFNSKYNLNFLNSSSNKGRAFKIYLSNKYFMAKTITLTQSHSILNQINNTNSFCGLLSSFSEVNPELSIAGNESIEGLVLIGELCFLREDCKWTCGVRLTSGPRSPVIKIADLA